MKFSSVQSQSCLTLCDPVDCSTPGFHVHHQLQVGVMKYVHAKSLQSCLTLRSYGLACQAPVRGILQARILEWVAVPSSTGSSQPRVQTHISYVSCIGRQVLYH